MSEALRFLGAAGTVTGAKFLVEGERARFLVECRMFQGLRELRARNWQPPPVEPGRLNAVLLSHAHLDHSGYLPRLVRDGFAGPIYCSPGTADLLPGPAAVHHRRPPSGTYAVHGEPSAAEGLRDAIEKDLGWPCRVAADGEQIRL